MGASDSKTSVVHSPDHQPVFDVGDSLIYHRGPNEGYRVHPKIGPVSVESGGMPTPASCHSVTAPSSANSRIYFVTKLPKAVEPEPLPFVIPQLTQTSTNNSRVVMAVPSIDEDYDEFDPELASAAATASKSNS